MSIICITQHNESIYQTTKPPKEFEKDSPRRKNKHYLKILRDKKIEAILRNPTPLMGKPKGLPLPDPKMYVKKGSYRPPFPKYIQKEPKKKAPSKLEATPPREETLREQDEKLKYTPKNFIKLNWQRLKRMQSEDRKPIKKRVVVDIHGNVRDLSDEVPKEIYKNNYGRVPEYLDVLIKKRERALQSKKDKQGLQQPLCSYITRDQREKILLGLKQNWEELQIQYQGLPILTDTIPKILRKSKLESDLKQLEKDIVLLERHPYIYVYNDDKLSP